MSLYGKRVLTPELLLLTLVRGQGYPSSAVLERLAAERGFKLADLARDAETLARERSGRNADFDFVTSDNRRVPLSDEMLTVLDEGRTVAQSMNEIYVGTVHALAAMSQRGSQHCRPAPAPRRDSYGAQQPAGRPGSGGWHHHRRSGGRGAPRQLSAGLLPRGPTAAIC